MATREHTKFSVGEFYYDAGHCFGSDVDRYYLLLSHDYETTLNSFAWRCAIFLKFDDGFHGADVRDLFEEDIERLQLVGNLFGMVMIEHSE